VKEGTFGRGAPRGNPSTRTHLFGAERRTSHNSKKKKLSGAQQKCPRKQKKQLLPNRMTEDRELKGPTAANLALGLMSIPGAAVAQKDHCHLVGHFRMPSARWSIPRNPQAPNGSV